MDRFAKNPLKIAKQMLTGFHWEKKVLCIRITEQGMVNMNIRMLSLKKRKKFTISADIRTAAAV